MLWYNFKWNVFISFAFALTRSLHIHSLFSIWLFDRHPLLCIYYADISCRQYKYRWTVLKETGMATRINSFAIPCNASIKKRDNKLKCCWGAKNAIDNNLYNHTFKIKRKHKQIEFLTWKRYDRCFGLLSSAELYEIEKYIFRISQRWILN